MKKKKLDFIVVGIQKSGTTLLAKYLSQNKQLFIPPEKEVPFFIRKRFDLNNWNNFLANNFSNARSDQLWGTVTAQYMMYPESLKRIIKIFPRIKIIVIYRDPINRLISHYDMLVRLKKEKRNLNKMIKHQLKNIRRLRKSDGKRATDKYLSSGEYYRLNKYLKIIPQKNILKLSFEGLTLKPKKTIEKISNFLGVKSHFEYSNKVIMAGGKNKILNIDHDKIFSKIKSYLVKLKIYQILPKNLIRLIYLISYWLDQNNVNKNSKSSIKDINRNELNMLRKHYKKDSEEYLIILKNDKKKS